ncbi:membrane protein [Arthrobacter phage Qui]|jgi:hypothetical protein|uniref:Membrane protein n=1 Tax=Arthrobacter phage Qui TaxID=2603260 RepID=A0A5B8WHT2_9CAUD|nr:membrane protein [Arthrobacter phage Qui]QED11589.1 membrane protein [Arthrobacter phage Qui]QOC56421.1 membrane protein [Arthrobacter phage Paella]
MARSRKRYGLGKFLFDLILGFLTCGIWWIFLLFKFFRTNS